MNIAKNQVGPVAFRGSQSLLAGAGQDGRMTKRLDEVSNELKVIRVVFNHKDAMFHGKLNSCAKRV
jgi:hypothetical protein